MITGGPDGAPADSNAPASHPAPCGRVVPRWSVPVQPEVRMFSAWLPLSSASVGVGPPLSASDVARRAFSTLRLSGSCVKPHSSKFSTFQPLEIASVPVQFDGVCSRRLSDTNVSCGVHAPLPMCTPPAPWVLRFWPIVTPVVNSAFCGLPSLTSPPPTFAVLAAIVEWLMVSDDNPPTASPRFTMPPPVPSPCVAWLLSISDSLMTIVELRFAMPPPLSAAPPVTRTRLSVTVLVCASSAPPCGAVPPCSVKSLSVAVAPVISRTRPPSTSARMIPGSSSSPWSVTASVICRGPFVSW